MTPADLLTAVDALVRNIALGLGLAGVLTMLAILIPARLRLRREERLDRERGQLADVECEDVRPHWWNRRAS